MHLYYETEQFVRPHLLACRELPQLWETAAVSPFSQMTKQRLRKSKAADLDPDVT